MFWQSRNSPDWGRALIEVDVFDGFGNRLFLRLLEQFLKLRLEHLGLVLFGFRELLILFVAARRLLLKVFTDVFHVGNDLWLSGELMTDDDCQRRINGQNRVTTGTGHENIRVFIL